MVLLLRFLPAVMLAVAVTVGSLAVASPATAAGPAAAASAKHPAHVKAVKAVKWAKPPTGGVLYRRNGLLLAAHGTGGNLPPRSVLGPCYTKTKQVTRRAGRRVVAFRVSFTPTKRDCFLGGGDISAPLPVPVPAPTVPAPQPLSDTTTSAPAPTSTEAVIVAAPVFSEPTTAGDPPPPGDEPAAWGPGSPDWEYRVTVP